MKLHKFNEFTNENLLDKMTPKSDEDLSIGIDKIISRLDDDYNKGDAYMHDIYYVLENIFKNNPNELTKQLSENGFNIFQLLSIFADEWSDYVPDNEKDDYIKPLLDIIKNNKDKIKPNDLPMEIIEMLGESLLDKMEPKSEEEINDALDKLMVQLKDESVNANTFVESMVYYLRLIYNTDKELINALLDNGVIDSVDLLTTFTDSLDHMHNPSDRELNYKKKILGGMYNLILKNKDNIDLDELML
jgi:hemerythrin